MNDYDKDDAESNGASDSSAGREARFHVDLAGKGVKLERETVSTTKIALTQCWGRGTVLWHDWRTLAFPLVEC